MARRPWLACISKLEVRGCIRAGVYARAPVRAIRLDVCYQWHYYKDIRYVSE